MIKSKKGPTPDQLQAFLERCLKEVAPNKEKVFDRLAREAGMSTTGVKKSFYAQGSDSWRPCKFTPWRLWHLVLFQEEPPQGE